MLRITMAVLHLLALGLGMGAVLTRGNTLREPLTGDSLRRTFRADNLWAFAALLWLVTGMWRLLASLEKPREYYMMNAVFGVKMALFALLLILEVWPIIVLMKWRRQIRMGHSPGVFASVSTAKRIAMLSHIEALLLVLIIFAAVTMARGYGLT